MSDARTAPVRAHQLKLDIGADTRADLVRALKSIAMQIDRDELTVGCTGGPDWGGSYEYRLDPSITHESYFAEVDRYLSDRDVKSMSSMIQG